MSWQPITTSYPYIFDFCIDKDHLAYMLFRKYLEKWLLCPKSLFMGIILQESSPLWQHFACWLRLNHFYITNGLNHVYNWLSSWLSVTKRSLFNKPWSHWVTHSKTTPSCNKTSMPTTLRHRDPSKSQRLFVITLSHKPHWRNTEAVTTSDKSRAHHKPLLRKTAKQLTFRKTDCRWKPHLHSKSNAF